MDDVSVVEVSHKTDANNGEDKNEKLFVVRPSLTFIEMRPNQVVDFQYDKEGEVRRGQVQDEPLFMGSCADKKVPWIFLRNKGHFLDWIPN